MIATRNREELRALWDAAIDFERTDLWHAMLEEFTSRQHGHEVELHSGTSTNDGMRFAQGACFAYEHVKLVLEHIKRQASRGGSEET